MLNKISYHIISYHIIMLICSPLHQGHHITSHHIISTSSSSHHHVVVVIVVIIIIFWHAHHLCPLCSISTFMFAFFLLLYRRCLLFIFSSHLVFELPSNYLTSLFFMLSRQSCSSMQNTGPTTALISLSLLYVFCWTLWFGLVWFGLVWFGLLIHPASHIRGLLEKYPTFGREKDTGLPGALDT